MASKSTEWYRKNGTAKKDAYNKAYNAKPEQKRRRAKRNASRRKAIMSGKISPNSNKDIHHVDGNPANTSPSNLKPESKKKNRGRK